MDSNSTPHFVDTRGAAKVLGVAAATLNRWRCHGIGPRWRRFGGSVRYALEDLRAWADQQVCASTSDHGTRAI